MAVWRNGMEIIDWKEYTFKKGYYVLTIRTPNGRTMEAIELRSFLKDANVEKQSQKSKVLPN